LVKPLQIINRAIPHFELEVVRWLFEHIRWLFEKENIEIPFPDTALFQIQFAEIATRTNTFISLIFNASIKNPTVREFIWDMPLLLLAAWAGWGISRRGQTLLAVAPSLVLHTYILQYTGKNIFSLQIAVFALILLIGVNQKWNFAADNNKTAAETYSVIFILSIALTIFAGLMPSISFKEVAKKLAKKDDLGKALGLDKESVQAVTSGASGLPRHHLIGLSPELSQTIIFTVKTGEMEPSESAILNEPVPRHYWRWLTYDVYNGQGWASSPIENNSYSANENLVPNTGDRYKIIHQQVEKAFVQDNRLYWTGSLSHASQPIKVSWRTAPESIAEGIDPILGADMLGGTIEQQSYQADSLVPIVSANQLRKSSQDYPQEIRTRYLSLPKKTPQRVRDLAHQLTANIQNPYDKAKAIESYLRTYPYSLAVTPPPSNRDVADYFLFDLKTGYCDYYATSMIVLARAAGLPARLVIGYSSGIYNPTKAEYVIREANAHSWVEVYFADFGWVEFEPTASQLPMILPEELPEESNPSITPFPTISETNLNAQATQEFSYKRNILQFVIFLTVGISLACSWFLRTQGLLRAHGSVGSIYEYIFYHGKKVYKNAPLYETPSIFADKLQARLKTDHRWLSPAPDEIRLLTELYLQETYSAHPITKDERIHAIKIWRKLFWRLLYARMIVRL
jgi:transglutaminase-like putative cysteine protease